MRYEDSMKGVAAQIIKEQQRASKIKNNPEEFHWHDEYATLNFFRFICLLESGRIDHSESDRNSQFELNRNSQCTLAN